MAEGEKVPLSLADIKENYPHRVESFSYERPANEDRVKGTHEFESHADVYRNPEGMIVYIEAETLKGSFEFVPDAPKEKSNV